MSDAIRSHILGPGRVGSAAPLVRHEPWDLVQPHNQGALEVPKFPASLAQASELAAIASTIPPAPGRMDFKIMIFESVGSSVNLSGALTRESRTDTRHLDLLQMHAWLRVHQELSNPDRFPVTAAMRWSIPQSEQVSSMIWYRAGGTMLCVLPTIRRVGLGLHLHIGHCILLHQGWMHAHDPDNLAHWSDLTTNYRQHFQQQGRAYWDIVSAFHQGETHWGTFTTMTDWVLSKVLPCSRLHRPKVATGTPDAAPLPIYYNRDADSFVHWSVNTPLFAGGTPQAAVLNDVRTAMIEGFCQFRDSIAPALPEPKVTRILAQDFIREEQ